MKIQELQPLLEMTASLRSNPSTIEVFLYVKDSIESANTPSMAQSACDAIATMCHPKAWGDLNVQNFGAAWSDWFDFLEKLEALAIACGKAIYENHAKQ